MSGMCSRENGRPSLAGSSQAIDLTATTTSGGGNRVPSGSIQVVESGQTLLEKALAPLGDDLKRMVDAAGDLLILQALGSHEDDLGP